MYPGGQTQWWMNPTFCFLQALLEKAIWPFTSNRPLISDNPPVFPVNSPLALLPPRDPISNSSYFLDLVTGSFHPHCTPYPPCSSAECSVPAVPSLTPPVAALILASFPPFGMVEMFLLHPRTIPPLVLSFPHPSPFEGSYAINDTSDVESVLLFNWSCSSTVSVLHMLKSFPLWGGREEGKKGRREEGRKHIFNIIFMPASDSSSWPKISLFPFPFPSLYSTCSHLFFLILNWDLIYIWQCVLMLNIQLSEILHNYTPHVATAQIKL